MQRTFPTHSPPARRGRHARHGKSITKLTRVIILLVLPVLVLGLSLTGFFYFSLHTTLAFVAGALGGILPDLLDEVPLWQERFRRTSLGSVWHRWHTRLHCADMANSWLTGVVIDALVVAGGVWLLLM